jgi:hypothetical protein
MIRHGFSAINLVRWTTSPRAEISTTLHSWEKPSKY